MQLFIKGFDGKTSIIHIDKEQSVDALMLKTSEHYGLDIPEIRLMYAGKQLEYGRNRQLEYYHIENNSTLYLLLRLRGGWNPILALQQRKLELLPLTGFISVCNEPDMISLDDDPDVKRAKMPCGHVIGPETMTQFAEMQLKEGKFRFLCPHVDPKTDKRCERDWEWFQVRHVAVLSEDQISWFEDKITENFLLKASGVQQCPGCQNMTFREDTKNLRVVCPLCSKRSFNRKVYEFCWACLHEWGSGGTCANPHCDGIDQGIKYLRDCSKKTIVGVLDCPSVRACPKCGILINHTDACKHMTCKCGYGFCFICLSKWGSCGNYNSKCSVAATQKILPNAVGQ